MHTSEKCDAFSTVFTALKRYQIPAAHPLADIAVNAIISQQYHVLNAIQLAIAKHMHI